MDTISKYAEDWPTVMAAVAALVALVSAIQARRAATRARRHATNALHDSQKALDAEARVKTNIAAQWRPRRE